MNQNPTATYGRRLLACCFLALQLTACATPARHFPLKEPLQIDPDRRTHTEEPEEYFSPFAWDAIDHTLFRPLSRTLAVERLGEATNVNALDEVPDSSWFTNRIAKLSREAIAQGPCVTAPLDPSNAWTVIGAKPNGANPGFIIRAANGLRYLLKFDGTVQGVRATAADVIGSRLYHASGYFTPCNRIVNFDPHILSIAPEAHGEDTTGNKVPLRSTHLDKIFSKAYRLPDGRYRANASLFIDGKPIGPWRYHSVRDDDPNDVIPHEMRRELRGAKGIAAWTNHSDAREQNTLGAWFNVTPQRGYVRHYIIDFGDCFGSLWEPPMLGRRIGQSHYLDVQHIAEDFLSLGLIHRSWDDSRFGASGKVFGYFDVDTFEPGEWKTGYPNPAFSAATERDLAWFARILAYFNRDKVDAILDEADFLRPETHRELLWLLMGRREKILRRYLEARSPLNQPTLRQSHLSKSTKDTTELCLMDMASVAELESVRDRAYGVRFFTEDALGSTIETRLTHARAPHQVCVTLPSSSSADATPRAAKPHYIIADFGVTNALGNRLPPARVHLYQVANGAFRIAGLERPATYEAPN